MMATIDKDLLLDKIDRLLKLHNYAREDWFANVIHNTVWDAPEIETDGDLISRADAIEVVAKEDCCGWIECKSDKIYDELNHLPSSQTDCTEFVNWLLDEVIDDDNWELNAISFGEIICRKLTKLGLLEVKDGYYVRTLSADAVQGWIPCSERLPKINQRVLLATNEGRVFVGYKDKPALVWRVTEADGREHWVYDPEHYTDDIDILLKEDDCSFSEDNQYSDGFMSVTSINYDDRFEGVNAWMPLPKPYKGGDDE